VVAYFLRSRLYTDCRQRRDQRLPSWRRIESAIVRHLHFAQCRHVAEKIDRFVRRDARNLRPNDASPISWRATKPEQAPTGESTRGTATHRRNPGDRPLPLPRLLDFVAQPEGHGQRQEQHAAQAELQPAAFRLAAAHARSSRAALYCARLAAALAGMCRLP